MDLRFRSIQMTDVGWLTEIVNDLEVAKTSLSIYPRTEHEVEEHLKKDIEDTETRNIVAEIDGEPAGAVTIWWRTAGRDRHVAWLGISVRRKHWAKGVGTGLVKEAIRIAKEMGFRKIMLGVFEGNERAMRLYRGAGFKKEAYEKEEVFIDGSWRNNILMGLEIAPCNPKLMSATATVEPRKSQPKEEGVLPVRHLENRDLDEVNRLQNCSESTKSSFRIPPVTREETKRWYEGIKSHEEKYCVACFNGNRLAGYVQFRTYSLPFPNLKFEEAIVDVNQKPFKAAEALVDAVKGFRERYWYRRIFAHVPETSLPIKTALEMQGFRKTGSIRGYYFLDGYYVSLAVYGYP